MERIHLTFMDIILDGNRKEYTVGDQVSGVVKLNINGQVMLSNINICLVCMAEVNWVENLGNRYHRTGHVYSDKKKFLDFTYAVPERSERNHCLTEGHHEIPFKFKLPESGIPSSFKSPHGSVTYYVEAVIEEPAIDEIHRMGQEIVVDAPFKEKLHLSVGNSAEKDFNMLSCGSGRLILHASLTKKGYVAGETVELHCNIFNQSSVEVTPRATLYQTQIYMCGERHKALELALTDAITGNLVEKEADSEQILMIPLPKDASLTIKCDVISIKYFIHVTLDIPHAFDIHVNLPIILTTRSALNPQE